jgi:anti-sigma factor RsiW
MRRLCATDGSCVPRGVGSGDGVRRLEAAQRSDRFSGGSTARGAREHVVNLFVWPSKRIGDEPLQRLSRRGYSAYCWAKDGMHYWAVSDLNEAELQKFVELGAARAEFH